jgi:hypothetical protein
LKRNCLDEKGWKRFRHYTRNKTTLGCIVNQTKVSRYDGDIFWKFGVLVQQTHKQARSNFKELVTLEYREQMEGYNQLKWYKDNKTDGGNFPIQYLHFQNDTLIILIVDVNLLLSWGVQVDYGVSQRAKLMYHHKEYNAFAALIGLGLLDCIIFWKCKQNASSNIVITRDHDFRRKHMIAHLKDRIHGYNYNIWLLFCNSY